MKSSSEISLEMDVESQEPGPAIPAPRKTFRPVVLVILAVRTFSSKAFNNKESIDSLGVSLLSPSPRNLELTEIGEISPIDHVCIGIHSNDEVGNAASDIKLQHEKIANIVKGRDLKSLHDQYGGVQGIAAALKTDLNNGITGEIGDPSRPRANAVYETPVPAARNFFELLMKSSNRYTIFLLIVSAALSLGFGIKEEGPRTGWYC